ncbi:MAG TPA: GNAT family N-acetyltransferase [Solirubrobacterales bacterium]|nr:GNAT family N-acetyltransferase [Solirubrobacterales bacterium]
MDELLTPRLRLRRWRAEDEAPMVAINSDPAVTEFLNRNMDAAATAAFLLRTQDHWDEHGFGHWAVEPREGRSAGEMIGFVGVAYPSYLPEVADRPELGWRLSPAAWGKGYATEAAFAARDDAFGRLGLPALISIIHPENQPSRRVATKLGMSIQSQVFNAVHDRDVDIWGVEC